MVVGYSLSKSVAAEPFLRRHAHLAQLESGGLHGMGQACNHIFSQYIFLLAPHLPQSQGLYIQKHLGFKSQASPSPQHALIILPQFYVSANSLYEDGVFKVACDTILSNSFIMHFVSASKRCHIRGK